MHYFLVCRRCVDDTNPNVILFYVSVCTGMCFVKKKVIYSLSWCEGLCMIYQLYFSKVHCLFCHLKKKNNRFVARNVKQWFHDGKIYDHPFEYGSLCCFDSMCRSCVDDTNPNVILFYVSVCTVKPVNLVLKCLHYSAGNEPERRGYIVPFLKKGNLIKVMLTWMRERLPQELLILDYVSQMLLFPLCASSS